MRYKLIISVDAHDDLDGIVAYIVHELQNPQAAASFLDNVETSYKRVVENPHLYSLCNDERRQRLGYRKIVIKNYLILYRVDDENKVIYIVRVIYGGRNYPEML